MLRRLAGFRYVHFPNVATEGNVTMTARRFVGFRLNVYEPFFNVKPSYGINASVLGRTRMPLSPCCGSNLGRNNKELLHMSGSNGYAGLPL
jgi:hypothetical protein